MKIIIFIPFVLLFFSFLIPVKSFADFCEQYDFGEAGTQHCRDGEISEFQDFIIKNNMRVNQVVVRTVVTDSAMIRIKISTNSILHYSSWTAQAGVDIRTITGDFDFREGDTVTYYFGAFGNQGCITGPNFVKLCGDDDPFIIGPVMLLFY